MTRVAGSTSSTDSVDVIINVRRQVVVDNVSDIGNVQSSSSDGGSDHDGRLAASEELQGTFSLSLGSVTVNGRSTNVGSQEEVGEHVGHSLRLDEDEGQSALRHRGQDVEKNGLLVIVFDEFNLLGDVLAGSSNSTDGEKEVLLEEVSGKLLNVSGEGGREHERLPLLNARHVFTFDDSSNLRLETHVEHSIGFVEDQESDIGKADSTSLDQVDQSAWGSREDVTASFDLS